MPTPYAPPIPSVTGSNITMEAFLMNPPRVQRSIEQLSLNRFLADRIYAEGPRAIGGAVLYDQMLEGEFYMERDVQAIEPASEFPVLPSGEHLPKVAAVVKWGGSAVFSYEQVRRDRRDLLRRDLTRLRNTIVRKIDTVGMAAIAAAPINTQAASADWSTTGDILGDIATGISTVDEADLGYEIDTGILNPAQALDIRKDPDVRDALPRENTRQNLIAARDLGGFAGIETWYVSNRQPAGTVRLLASGQIGGLSDELPLYSRTVDEQTKERYRVMSARIVTPYVTDPKAVVDIVGA